MPQCGSEYDSLEGAMVDPIQEAIKGTLNAVISLPPDHAEMVLRRALHAVESAHKDYKNALTI